MKYIIGGLILFIIAELIQLFFSGFSIRIN